MLTCFFFFLLLGIIWHIGHNFFFYPKQPFGLLLVLLRDCPQCCRQVKKGKWTDGRRRKEDTYRNWENKIQKQRLCLHAVASCEVSVDEVLSAEVLHPSGNVSHELHQHLRREVLQDTVTEGDKQFILCTVGGSRVHLFMDVRRVWTECSLLHILTASSEKKRFSTTVFWVFAELMDVSTFCRNLVFIRLLMIYRDLLRIHSLDPKTASSINK